MKKLFTTILMMGVALCSWADPSITGSLSSDGKTLTVTYVADVEQPNYLSNLKDKDIDDLAGKKKDWEGVETLVLVGDFANKDLSFISNKFVANCVSGPGNENKKIFLDLSGCTGMKSKVVKASDGTYNADIDWVTTEHTFLPTGVNGTASTTYDVTRTATPYSNTTLTVGLYSDDDVNVPEFRENLMSNNPDLTPTYSYNGGTIQYFRAGGYVDFPHSWDDGYERVTFDEEGWWWYTQYNKNLLKINKVTDSGETVTYTYEKDGSTIEIAEDQLDKDGNGDLIVDDQGYYKYTVTYTVDNSVFKFSDGAFNNSNKLNGIAFPNNADFNYIPEGLCKGFTWLTSVTFGNYTEWIGQEAFSGCTALTDPVFPATMKVFGGDSFKECNSFTKVDLSVLPKIQIVDYMAFGSTGTTEATSNLAEFILPSNNTSLKYFANYVIRGTKVKKLDFTGCKGIVNFAHDGKATFGEFSANWDSYWTFYGSSELEEVILPPNLSYLTVKAFNTCPALQSVTFLGDAVYDKSTCVEGGTNTITNPLIIDEEAFNKDYTLSTVVFCNRITEIRACAFQNTGLTSVTIPASVEVIGVRAFSECTALTTVTFEDIDENCKPCKHAKTVIAGEHRKVDPETGEYVYTDQQAVDPATGEPMYDDDGNPIMEIAREGDGDGAFFNCQAITDVYINAPDAEIICENKAFDYVISFGQTDPNGNFATLHYPEGEEEKYVNLSHYLTDEVAHTPGLFQKWLQDHFNWATKPNNNGWHEFINSGPSENTDEPPYEDGDVFLRTYSDPNYARIVPKGVKAYLVKSYVKDDDSESYQLTLQSIAVIPAQTGVILYGQPNANAQGGGKSLAMTAVQFAPGEGIPLRRDYWGELATTISTNQSQNGITEADATRLKNYLMPIIDGADILKEDGTIEEDVNLLNVQPYEKENGVVAFRNFALNRLSSTKSLKDQVNNSDGTAFDKDNQDYVGFFRILKAPKGGYDSGYAYLHFAADEYNTADGAECIVIKDDKYKVEIDTSNAEIDYSQPDTPNPNNLWKYTDWTERKKNWGDRTGIAFKQKALKYFGEFEEEADGIVKVVVPAAVSGDTYTLQGVKVTNPTKGVYIRNGKKVVIK